MTQTALFTNFSNEEYTGYYDGKPRTFAPGESLYMPDYLARHYAKHLVNRELLRRLPDGRPVYPDGEKMTSPKFPKQVPLFMELFNKAYVIDGSDELGQGETSNDAEEAVIASVNKNKTRTSTRKPKAKAESKKQNPDEPQIVVPADFDEDEEEFEGKPVDNAPKQEK